MNKFWQAVGVFIGVLLLFTIQWGVSCLGIWAICAMLGYDFSLRFASAVWIGLIIIKINLFSNNSNNQSKE